MLCARALWHLLEILVTGGSFGSHTPKDFGPFYRSEHWRSVRAKAIEIARGKCAVCGYDYEAKGSRLLVRHTRKWNREGKSVYGREDPERDLICLCEDHIGSTPYRKKEFFAFWRKAYGYYRPLQR